MFDSVYSGEKYDARRADQLGHWRAPGYRTGRDWRPATVLIPPGSCSSPSPKYHGALPATTVPDGFKPAVLRAHEAEPVLVDRTLRPISITETAPGSGTWVLDYGQILTGFVRLALTGTGPAREGLTLRIRGGNRIVAGDGTTASRSRSRRRTSSTTPTFRRTTTPSAGGRRRPGSSSSATSVSATWR